MKGNNCEDIEGILITLARNNNSKNPQLKTFISSYFKHDNITQNFDKFTNSLSGK